MLALICTFLVYEGLVDQYGTKESVFGESK